MDDVSRPEVGELRIVLDTINSIWWWWWWWTLSNDTDADFKVSRRVRYPYFLVDSDYPTKVQLVSTVADVGGSWREMVFQSGSPCGWRICSTDLNSLWLAKSILIVLQDGGLKPEVVFRDGSQCGGRRIISVWGWPNRSQTVENDWTNFTQLLFTLYHGYGHLGAKNIYPLQIIWSNIRFG